MPTRKPGWEMPTPCQHHKLFIRPRARPSRSGAHWGWGLYLWCDVCKRECRLIGWPFEEAVASAGDLKALGFEIMEPGP